MFFKLYITNWFFGVTLIYLIGISIAQLTFTCSKSATETLEKGVNYVQIKKTPEQRKWHPSGVFIVYLEHISHFFLVFLLLTLNK